MNTLPILIYHGDYPEKGKDLYQELETLGYNYKVIDDDSLHQTLGHLIGLEGFDKQEVEDAKHFPMDIMIFPTMEKEEVSAIAKALREKEVDISRKAMLTEHNRHWKLYDLIDELNEEHYYFARRSELQALLMQCMKIHPDNVPNNIKSNFQQSVVEAYDLLNKQCTLEEIEHMISVMLPLYEQLKDSIPSE